MTPKPVSIIISAYNAAATLKKCLQSLSQQTYPTQEILVIDDGSTDNTAGIARAFPSVRYYHRPHQGPAPARNFGASKAKGQILVFVDADMTFEPDFIQKLIAPILSGQARGTFTQDEYVANWHKPLARCWNYLYTGSTSKKRVPPHSPPTSPVFRAVLKSEFDSVQGFDSIGYNDDWTLSQKLGYPSQAAPGAVMYHKNPDTYAQVFSQASWIGKRRYKLGEWGKLIALFRANPLFALITGAYGALKFSEPTYFPFKLVYNSGVTVGLIAYFFGKNHAK